MKIVLTRNFKNHTPALYCAAEFGVPPEGAIEIDGIHLENAKAARVASNNETRGYANFGCGVLIIGEGKLPAPAVQPKHGKLTFNYDEWLYPDRTAFTSCNVLEAGKDGLTVIK